MAIERPDTFSDVSDVRFLVYNSGVSPSVELERVKYIKVVCQTQQIKITSSKSDTGLAVLILTSSGNDEDSVFEITAPNNGVIRDLTIEGQGGGGSATGIIYYILG